MSIETVGDVKIILNIKVHRIFSYFMNVKVSFDSYIGNNYAYGCDEYLGDEYYL